MKYISSDFYDWDISCVSSKACNYEELYRAYDILAHAETTLLGGKTEFYRVDAIGALKRSINQRLKTIEKYYNFNSKNLFGKSKRYLDNLEVLGIVRPFLIKQLFEVRNDIEHNDKQPPSYERCLELIDVV